MLRVTTLMIWGCCWGVLSQSSGAVGPEAILLWPEGAPGAIGDEDVDRPAIRIYPAQENPNGAAVVVCPGGGYGALATDHEGHQVAKWLNSIGVTAAVVKYRLGPRYHHPAPLQDAQRAIRYVRAHATEWEVDPHRVGIMGFSAGGHLAATVSTHFDDGQTDADDPIARQSSRPDFSILCYAVVSFSKFGHSGSRRNLLGENPDPELVRSLSNETQVSAHTPPAFLFHTGEDAAVPVKNSLVYYQALVDHGVPAELHVYQRGPHGVGLAPGDPILSTWTDRLADWLKSNGLLLPSNTERGTVSGKIHWGDEPLRWGSVAFIPEDPNSPSAFAMVSRGTYELNPGVGVCVGNYRVRIVNLGSVVPVPTIEDALEFRRGRIAAAVTGGANVFDFDLTP